MAQNHDSAEAELTAKMEQLNMKIESVTVIASSLPDL